MEMNSSLLLLAATALHVNNSDILRELQKAVPIVCKPYHPVYVFYDVNLSLPQQPVLDQFFAEYTHPLSVITQTDTYYDTIPSESCTLLFLGNFTQVEKLRKSGHYQSEHPRLIVTHISFFIPLLLQFEKYTLINCVYFVHNESRYGIFHYDDVRDTLNRWTTIRSNPIVDLVSDLNGKTVFVHPNIPLEPLEMHLLRLFAARQNGTVSSSKPVRSWIVFNSLEHVYEGPMRRYIYTIRNTNYRALVPRLGERQPLLAILLDPFDAATWLVYGAMIMSVAILRMWFSQLCTWKHLVQSIQDIFSCVLLSSPRIFYRPMEQATVGLFMLLNVVLLSAYESLVISFLLNPRFYPEIDTVKQFDERCCWYVSNSIAVAARGPCWFNTNNVGVNETLPLKYLPDRYTCFMLEPRHRRFWNETLLIPLVTQRYRWSKAMDYSQYVFGLAFYDIGVAEVLQKYVDAFFAEGALYTYFDRVDEVFGTDEGEKAVRLNDLLLLWMCYFCGLAICVLVLFGEIMVHNAKKFRIWVPIQLAICTIFVKLHQNRLTSQ